MHAFATVSNRRKLAVNVMRRRDDPVDDPRMTRLKKKRNKINSLFPFREVSTLLITSRHRT